MTIIFLSSVLILGFSYQPNSESDSSWLGKYCEDLGFGWICIEFKPNHKCMMNSGHSTYIRNKSRGNWSKKSDTIEVFWSGKKSEAPNITFYLLKSDTLYDLNIIDNQFVRGSALEKVEN